MALKDDFDPFLILGLSESTFVYSVIGALLCFRGFADVVILLLGGDLSMEPMYVNFTVSLVIYSLFFLSGWGVYKDRIWGFFLAVSALFSAFVLDVLSNDPKWIVDFVDFLFFVLLFGRLRKILSHV